MPHLVPQVGDKVHVTTRDGHTGGRMKRYSGVTEAVTEHFMTVDIGRYRITVLTADIHCGQAMVDILRRAEEEK